MKRNVTIFLICFISFTKIFSISNNSINNPPVASDQNITVTEQMAGVINLVGTDADSDKLSYIIVDAPSNGTYTISGRTVIYTSNSDTASSDSFTFKVNDGTVDSSIATITISITPVNDSPVAVSQDDVSAIENIEKSITLTGNDPEGDSLSYILVATPSNGRLLDPADSNNTIFKGSISSNQVTYISSSDNATSDSFIFKSFDGNSASENATVSILISQVNDIPLATSKTVFFTEKVSKNISLEGSDPDGAHIPIEFNLDEKFSGMAFAISNDPEDASNNTGKVTRGTYIWDRTGFVLDEPVKIVKDGDNKYSVKVYSPDASTHKLSMVLMQSTNNEYIALTKDFSKGWNTLEFDFSTVSSQSYPRSGQFWDGTADFMKIEFRIDHGESNPGAYYHLDDIKKVNQSIDDSFVFKIITIPNGALTDPNNNDQAITSGTIIKGNKVTFLSKEDASSDSFTFTVNDGLLESEESSISIKIITDAPTAEPQNVNVTEQTDKKITLTGTDKEEDELTYIVSTLPLNGTLKDDGVVITNDNLPKTIKNTDITYKSNSDSALTDRFNFKVNDGISDSPPGIISISISPVNDQPIAIEQSGVVVTEQVSVNITIAGTDPDGDDITYSIVDSPANGTANLVGTTVTYLGNSDTALTDSFTFKVNDGKVDSSKATVALAITPVNDNPVPISQTISTVEDIKLEIILSGIDADKDVLIYSIVASPIKGTATLKDSLVTYVPELGYFGNDSFIFRVSDGKVLSTAGFVQISITSNDFDEDGILNDFDKCPDTPTGSKVNTDGCVVFELPFNNNKVEVISATCIAGNDGLLSLSVEDDSHDYSISVNGNNFGQSIVISGENKTASVTGLAKGTYSVCFKVDGQADYEQCFEVAIGEPKALSAFVDVDNDKRTTNIQLGGSNSYNIEVNGERFDVKGDRFNTTLPTGLSIIKISTDLDCQGVIEREIFISEDIFYYPNPTRGEVDVFVNGEDKGVKMSVFTTKGDLVFTRDQEILDSRKTELDLTGVPSGTYLVTLEGTTVRKTFKIVKK